MAFFYAACKGMELEPGPLSAIESRGGLVNAVEYHIDMGS